MRAALRFVRELTARKGGWGASITVDLYGSLALTGVGHGTDRAVMMGLMEESPDTVDLDRIGGRMEKWSQRGELKWFNFYLIKFDPATDIHFHRDQMYPDPGVETHPNGMRFTSFDEDGKVVFTQVYYSIGGGFILSADEFANASTVKKREVPYAFSSADQLLELCKKHSMTIAEIVLANEIALLSDPTIVRRIDRIVSPQRPDNPAPVHLEELTPEQQVKAAILTLWRAMEDCIARGIATEGTLPGGLNVRRRAPGLARRLAQLDAKQDETGKTRDPLAPLDSVTLVAMAVNEENAAGGRVVTAPTNGAAGVVPAIAYYWMKMCIRDRVLPEPGGPIIRMLCPPATATSTARLTCSWPFTSAKSCSIASNSPRISFGSTRTGNMPVVPARNSTASRRCRTGKTSRPATTAASEALAAGSMSPFLRLSLIHI